MSIHIPQPFSDPQGLVTSTNTVFREMGFDDDVIDLNGAEELFKENIALPMHGEDRFAWVDDDSECFVDFLRIIYVTGGRISFVLQREGDSIEQLTTQTVQTQANMALLDFSMRQCKGTDLVDRLRRKAPRLGCIGFSTRSGESIRQLFSKVGAAFVHKNIAEDPRQVLLDIAEIIPLVRL